jgi:hypothetical protein
MSRLSIGRARLAVASLALTLTACNGDGPSGPPPAITLALSSTTLTVQQSQSGTVTMTVGRLNNFASAVTLSLEGASAGVTGTFNPASVPNGSTTSTLTVSASGTAPLGTHTLTVRARGQGVSDQTATLTLTVVAPPTLGLALNPTTLSVQQGQSGTSAVTITRAGSFARAVDLSAEGVPTGVTVSFNPATIAAGATTSTMTVGVGTGAATGQFTITVRARGQGVPDQTATFTLQITPSTGGTSVTFQFCQPPQPIWVAYQDDTGPWTLVPGNVLDAYTFTITSSRGGVAIVTPNGTGFDTQVIYATASELATIGASWDAECAFTPDSKQLSGTVAGVGANDHADITLGPVNVFVAPGQPTSFTLQGVPAGPLDLVATRGTSSFPVFTTNKLILRRGLNLPNGSTIPVLDFNSAEAVAPVAATLTVANLLGEELVYFASYITAGGTAATLTANLGAVGGTQPYQGVPSSLQAAGDLHEFLVLAGTDVMSRLVVASFHGAANRTVTLGSQLAPATVNVVSALPYARYRLQLMSQSEYGQMAVASFEQANATAPRTTTVFATDGYFGGTPASWELTIPDLTGAGYEANWGLRPNTTTDWTATAAGGSLFTIPGEGTTLIAASRTAAAPLAVQSVLRALRPSPSIKAPAILRLPSRP